MSRSFTQASLLAMTLGLAALGSTPAAALSSMHPGNVRLPSLPAQKAPSASMHPGGAMIHVSQVAPGAGTHPGSATVHLPQIAQTGHPGSTTVQLPQLPTPPGTSAHPGSTTVHLPEMPIPPGASAHPGSTTPHLPQLSGPLPLPNQNKPDPMPHGPIDNICPFNPSKCPPKAPDGPGPVGNQPQGPGSTPSMPGGQTYPTGNAGPVVIVGPAPVYEAPTPVYQAPTPVYQATRPVVTATNAPAVATAPCNCLTKQYLSDGSVLFQDLCTKEAATATPDELRAQAQAAAPVVR